MSRLCERSSDLRDATRMEEGTTVSEELARLTASREVVASLCAATSAAFFGAADATNDVAVAGLAAATAVAAAAAGFAAAAGSAG
jgi:hypothetical protein